MSLAALGWTVHRIAHPRRRYILTAAGAVALLGEPLSAALFVAAALVAAGMWLARPART